MTDILDSALALAFTGLPVFPCAVDKRPACDNGLYDASTDPDVIARLFANPRAALIGVPAGPASGFDAIDIDKGRDGLDWLAANESRLPASRTHHTRSGGKHILLKHTPGMRTKFDKIARGVEVRGEGGFIIWWPAHGHYAEGATFAPWPDWLLIDAMRGTRKPGAAPVDPASLAPPSAADLIALLRAMPNPADTSRGDYVNLNLAVQGCIRGLEALGTADAEQAEEIREAAADWCSRWDSERAGDYETELARWEKDWSLRDDDKSGWRHVLDLAERLGVDVSVYRQAAAAAEFDVVPDEPEPAATSAPTRVNPDLPIPPGAVENWRWKLLCDKEGNPIKGMHSNVLQTLRISPFWYGLFRLNTFATRLMVTREPPWISKIPWTGPREIQNEDYGLIVEWMEMNMAKASEESVVKAVAAIAREWGYSPLRDYLNSLKWDGTPRADAWLIDHLGAADTRINRAFGAKFLISAVARGLHPGRKVDTVLVLEGVQGLRKSSALRALASDAWFVDHLPKDLGDKDTLMQIHGSWIVEHAEMASLRGSRADHAKEFISRQTDRFRPPFGREVADFPRQCVFAATVNPGGQGYLQDETGARRFWTVACGVGWEPGRKIDTDALSAVRNQLWAEAVHRFRAGEPWWLETHALESEQAEAANARYDEDTWTDEIAKLAAREPFVKVADVLTALGLSARDQTKAHQMRAATVLRALGWSRKSQWIEGKTVRTFVPPLGTASRPETEEPDDKIAALR